MLPHHSCYKSHRMAPKNDTMHVRLLELFKLVWEKNTTLSADAPYPHWVISLTRGSVGKQCQSSEYQPQKQASHTDFVSGTHQKIQILSPQGIRYFSAVQYRWIQELWELWKGPPPNLSPNYICQPQESMYFHWRRFPTSYYSTEKRCEELRTGYLKPYLQSRGPNRSLLQ